MSTKPTDRRAFGVATLAVLALPVVIMIGGMGLSFQSSTARLFTSSVWMSYVGLELAEAAVAEASHCLKPADVLDPGLFPTTGTSADPATDLVTAMVGDTLTAGIAPEDRQYRDILGPGDAVACHMLVAFRFPRQAPRIVAVPGLARKIASENPGVLLDSADDLVVRARPVSFRREFYKLVDGWVNWGIVQFTVTVRTRELKGVSAHTLRVDRRFTLKTRPKPGEEILTVSSRNLRTECVQEDR